MNKSVAMILAGGRGKRMGVLCDRKPKPALPFAGKYRVIDFSLSNCLNSGIDTIGVLTGYQSSYLGRYLKNWKAARPGKKISILEPRKKAYLGTADAVFQNLNYLSRLNVDTVLVLAADHVYKMDYRKMMDFHQKQQADVTVGVISVPIERACHFGTVITDGNDRITDFVEKPEVPHSNLVSMGIYVFNLSVLNQRLREDAAQPDSVHDFGHVILPKMVEKDRVFAYKFNAYWQDIGTPEAYHQANLDLTHERGLLGPDEAWPINSPENNRLSAKNIEHPNCKSSLIGPGCVIQGQIENSVISPGVRVAENAVVQNSVIMANVSIGRHCRISNAIIDEGVTTGEHCVIGSFNSANPQITVLGQNTVVPSYAQVQANGDMVIAGKSKTSRGMGVLDIIRPDARLATS